MNLSDAIGLEIERREKGADDFLPICVPKNAAEIRRIYKEQRELVAALQARIEALEKAAAAVCDIYFFEHGEGMLEEMQRLSALLEPPEQEGE